MFSRKIIPLLQSSRNMLKIAKLPEYRRNPIKSITTNHNFHNYNKSKLNFIEENPNLFKRIVKRINIFDYTKTKRKLAGFMFYESIVSSLSYEVYFKQFSLPDTFYSWFVITELHIWMLSVRLMNEEDGKVTRNAVIEALWSDVQVRSKKLGEANLSSIRQQINSLSEQFHAALIGYDEGLLSNDDRILASAIWRRMYQMNCDDPIVIEDLVQYIRKQISHLDKVPAEELLNKKRLTWLPLKSK